MAGPIDLDDYRWLTGDAAQVWLGELRGEVEPPVALVARLRRELSAARTHLVLEQSLLRRRAVGKFGLLAERMFFTARGLEQATDLAVAAYKASRFPVAQGVADLCCGIGGDLLALAARGSVQGIDRDPVAALLAEANCRAVRSAATFARSSRWTGRLVAPSWLVKEADVADLDISSMAAWHIDPDRRPHGRRTTRVELHQPGPVAIDALRAACPHAAIKLAPAAVLSAEWEDQAELEWISRGGECRQLVAWFAGLTGWAGFRRATMIDFAFESVHKRPQTSAVDDAASLAACSHQVLGTVIGRPGVPVEAAAAVGRFLFEPDAAVLAADLRGALADRHKLRGFDSDVAYLTGDTAIDDAALDCFAVSEVLPFQPKRIRALLRERGIGHLEVKQRGTPHDANALQREFASSGERHATLFVTRVGGKVAAILAQRMGGKMLSA